MNKAATYCYLLLVAAGPANALGQAPAPPRVAPSQVEQSQVAHGSPSPLAGWSRLQLDASKFLIASAHSTLDRWLPTTAGGPGIVRVHSALSYLGNTRLHDGFSVRPGDAPLPARWMEIDPGKRAREIRVVTGGELTLRRFDRPEGKEPPWSGPWTEGNREVKTLDLARGGDGCGGPIDPWALLGSLECLLAGPEVGFRLFSNDGIHAVIARRVQTSRTTLQLRNLDGGEPIDVSVEVATIELLPGPGEPDPSVFGLDGAIRLQIDTGSGALVQIEGRREGIPGLIRFRLSAVARRERPRPRIPWPTEATSATAVPAL